MTKISPTMWPKPYLLQIYETAIEQGCCRVRTRDEQQSKGLVAAFYRLRRRSDKQHKDFIKPVYHLVSCTIESSGVLFTFNRLPDGSELPKIEIVPESERVALVPQQLERAPERSSSPSSAPLDMNSLMQDLLKDAGLQEE